MDGGAGWDDATLPFWDNHVIYYVDGNMNRILMICQNETMLFVNEKGIMVSCNKKGNTIYTTT